MLQPAGRGCRAVLWLGLALAAAGCVPLGPSTLPSDQVDYADAISEASKRLTLTNIVKTRYGDAPSYLVASQVVAGYQLQANVSVNADVDTSNGFNLSDSTGLTVGGQFNNNPTITYTPVAGADFAALLLAPIAPADLYALIAGGTPPDLVLGLLLGQINGLRNDLIERPGTTASDGRFREFLDLALALHAAGAFHIRVEGTGKTRSLFLALPVSGAAKEIGAQIERFLALLGLDARKEEFPIVYGNGSGAPETVTMLTRSISEILHDLASLIDVPPEDVAAGRTYADLQSRAGRPQARPHPCAGRTLPAAVRGCLCQRPLPRPVVLDRQCRLPLQAGVQLHHPAAPARPDHQRPEPAGDHHPERVSGGNVRGKRPDGV